MSALAEADVVAELRVSVARTDEELSAALRLRHQVFVRELGARGTAQAGLERDEFDAHCLHLIVREGLRGDVVGTYRVLMPQGARLLGEPHCDPDFGCADLPLLLDVDALSARYRRRFGG